MKERKLQWEKTQVPKMKDGMDAFACSWQYAKQNENLEQAFPGT